MSMTAVISATLLDGAPRLQSPVLSTIGFKALNECRAALALVSIHRRPGGVDVHDFGKPGRPGQMHHRYTRKL